jgi:predicted nucleotidyltransferase
MPKQTRRASAQQIIRQMVRRLVKQFDPEQIILFGSQARGTAGPESDVDLLVVMTSVSSKRKLQLAMRLALHQFLIPFDVIVTTPDEINRRKHIPGTIIRPALIEGKVLYVRG